MKAMKGMFIVLLVVMVLVVAAVFLLWSSLDTIVASAIEEYGSQATRTDVRVDAVRLELTEGKGTIAGISVANPRGFTTPNVFELGEIRTTIDIETVTQNPIVIDEIFVGAPAINYEIDEQGKSNIEALQRNMSSSASSESQETGSGEEPLKLIVRKFVVESGRINAKIAALPDEQLSAGLPRIDMRNLGSKQGGAPPEAIAAEIVDILIQRVGTAVVRLGVEKYLDKSVDELKRQAQEAMEQELDDRLGKGLREGLDILRRQ